MPANFSGKRSAMAAFGSALIASLLVYPTEMLKTRLIVQPSKLHYHGILHGFRQIWRAEGFFALYKGILPTFLGEYNSPAISCFMNHEAISLKVRAAYVCAVAITTVYSMRAAIMAMVIKNMLPEAPYWRNVFTHMINKCVL